MLHLTKKETDSEDLGVRSSLHCYLFGSLHVPLSPGFLSVWEQGVSHALLPGAASKGVLIARWQVGTACCRQNPGSQKCLFPTPWDL